MTKSLTPLLKELAEKLNVVDIETSYDDDILLATIRGGASLPDEGVEVALNALELGPRAIAVQAIHLSLIDKAELPESLSLNEALQQVREECIFARSYITNEDDGNSTLVTDASFLVSDFRHANVQTLLTGLTLFAEEALLTIGTLYFTEELDKEEN